MTVRAASVRRGALLIVLAYLGFISLGLPDGVLGLVWPDLQRTFALPRGALGAPLAVGAVTYFVSGLFAGKLTLALGVGGLLAGSTALVAAGVATYAATPSFALFLLGAAIIGFGSGGVDAGLNAYAARYFRARHMSWLHAAYSLGAASGPAIVTVLFAYGGSFRAAYGLIAAVLAALTLGFTLTRRSWVDPEHAAVPRAPIAGEKTPGAWSAIRDARVRLQVLLFFTYTGIEVGAGQWSYTLLTQHRGVEAKAAGIVVTGYWVSLLVGRIVSGFVVERIGTARLVRLGAFGAVVGAVLFALPLPFAVSALGLWLVGLSLAPVFPGLMSETPRRVGEAAAPFAVGFQVSAATTGVAVLPNAAGLLGEELGLGATGAFIALTTVAFALLHEGLVRIADQPAE